MKVRTFSIVAGSMACNAQCPFCVAHMTPANGLGSKEPRGQLAHTSKRPASSLATAAAPRP